MSAWSERQSVADLWIDARRGGSTAFRLLGSLQQIYRTLRVFAKHAYHALRRLRSQRAVRTGFVCRRHWRNAWPAKI